ncbi:hypothetical protein [Dysgonomonas sp. 511]|uniref:hypothetical protein n=1 Tax=Dysgonomonas sp. 511 TaxID=2302930 RepID=UPI0016243D79|nr:hypothetical protein [Dysgonomonas sp. 511]
MNNIFSTRELASIIWLVAILATLWVWSKGRFHLKEIAKSAFAPKLTITYLSLIAYVFLIVVLLWQCNFWNLSLLKDTIIWFIFSALGVFFSLNKVKDASYFGQLIKDSISVTVIIEFFVNLYAFSLLAELIIFPCLVFIVALSAYSEISAKTNKEHKKVNSCLNQLLGIIGLIYMGFALYKTIMEFKTVPWIDVSKQFILPVILTVSSVPYFWGLALYMKYESMFVASNRFFKDRSKIERLKIKIYVLYYGNFSFKRVYRIWKKIGFLAYEEGTNYRKYIKQVASSPTYKKTPIINKMSIQLFNDIDACCKSLSSLEIGELSEWNQLHGLDEFYCSNSYYCIQPYGLSNLLLSLQGEELHIHQLELSLSIHSIEEREEAILKFRECVEVIFRLLLLEVPQYISNSILRNESCSYSNNSFSLEFTVEIIGKVESFVLLVKSKKKT